MDVGGVDVADVIKEVHMHEMVVALQIIGMKATVFILQGNTCLCALSRFGWLPSRAQPACVAVNEASWHAHQIECDNIAKGKAPMLVQRNQLLVHSDGRGPCGQPEHTVLSCIACSMAITISTLCTHRHAYACAGLLQVQVLC